MKRNILAIAGLASLLLLSGCSVQGGSSSAPGGSSGGELSQPAPGSGPDAAAPGGDASGTAASGAKGDAVAPDSQVVTTGAISLLADDPFDVSEKAVALVESIGGHVDGRTETGGRGTSGSGSNNDGGTRGPGGTSGTGGASTANTLGYPPTTPQATLVLRIPSDKVTSAIDGLKALATVETSTITSEDVTTQVADVNGRITALQTSVNRLLDLMSKATTTTDLIALESTLSERQSDLDGLTAQRDALTDQVRYASITVTVDAISSAPAVAPADFWSGLSAGWSSLVAALGGALVVFGVALPWLVVLAIIAAAVILIVRLTTRRRHPAAE